MKAVSTPVALVVGKRKRVSRADKAAADAATSERKTARLFTNGASQAVRLPKEFRMSGTEVRIWKEGNRVVMEPVQTGWDAMFAAIAELPENFRIERNQPPMQARDWNRGLQVAGPVEPYRSKRKRP